MSALGNIFNPIFSTLSKILFLVLLAVVYIIVAFFIIFFIRYKINPFKVTIQKLKSLTIQPKIYDLLRWMWIDFLDRKSHINEFSEYGFTFYVGRQGAGKTISMVDYLDRIKKRYPNCMIVTNFKYDKADYIMIDWHDLLEVRNGTKGIVFAIDEIHSEYSAASWKDVPESLLSEISQQRKQRVKIIASAQVFSRIAKPLREQANDIVMCSTYFNRLTRTVRYDAMMYAAISDNSITVKKRLRPISKRWFVQSDFMRDSYDTYEKIERMKHIEFTNRNER